MVNNVKVLSFLSYKVLVNDDAVQYKFFKHSKKTMKICIYSNNLNFNVKKHQNLSFLQVKYQPKIVLTRNTFYKTRYLSHCCVLFCIKTFFL